MLVAQSASGTFLITNAQTADRTKFGGPFAITGA
jgi:hypothetical protein